MHFRLYPLRFHFRALDSIHFPEGKSSNILRGALGMILRRMACVPYASIFEPRQEGTGPSGLADAPRPFVFRATHLDGVTIRPGATFHFDLNLFELRNPAAIPALAATFTELVRDGLGPRRGRAELLSVDGDAPLSLSLDPPAERVDRIRVDFVTPTELKSGQALADRPEFHILASRIRDRLSTLRQLYDHGPLDIDFRAFAERAQRVRMTRCELKTVNQVRRSSRTGQTHPLGGFVGQAEYEGELAEFVPYLQAASWTGVGRQTVWGKGQIAVAVTSPDTSRGPTETRASDDSRNASS